MKTIVKVVTIATVLAIAACSSGGNSVETDAGEPNGAALPSMRTIETVEDFTTTIVGKTMVLRNEDGTRNPESQIVVNLNMKATGFNENGDIDLDWYWENSSYCRSGVSNLPDNPRTIELECQAVAVDGNIASFIRESGSGEVASSWFIE